VEKAIEAIRKKGYDVQEFTPYHFRVEGKLDIFPNDKMYRPWKWHDTRNGMRGALDKHTAIQFVSSYLGPPQEEAPLPDQVEFLVNLGWERAEAEKEVASRNTPRS